jgi:transposase
MLQGKKATLLRLRKMIFGRKSEQRKKADPESSRDEEKKDATGDTDNGAAKGQAGRERNEKSESEASDAKRRGHGRIPASAYRGAKKVYCRHSELSSGSPCPDPKCEGKVYPVIRPHGFIQFTGSPVINATHYLQEVVKCAMDINMGYSSGEFQMSALPQSVVGITRPCPPAAKPSR